MPPGATDHLVIFGYFVGGLLAMLGVAWRGLKWLKQQIREEFRAALSDEAFEKKVETIVARAFTGQAEIDSAWRRGIETQVVDLKERQNSQATSISEAHRRIDRLLEGRT